MNPLTPCCCVVVKKLDPSKVTSWEVCCRELQHFVTSYLALREFERKAIKESGDPFPAKGLDLAVAQVRTVLMHRHNHQNNNNCTDRYSGGAKERAEERMRDGKASKDDLAVLRGDSCAWCGKGLSKASQAAGSIYCSQVCSEEGSINRGTYSGKHIREQVFARDQGVCQKCKIDAHALFSYARTLEPANRLSALLDRGFRLPKSDKAYKKLIEVKQLKEGDFWEADHIIPVAEGGGGCSLDNLRTLCKPCHSEETEKLRHRLKLSGGVQKATNGSEPGDGKRKQMDIRSVFSQKAHKRQKI
jgi:5-methylcytosine-specific restriction protein A